MSETDSATKNTEKGMKRITISIISSIAVVLTAVSCAKEDKAGPNEAEKRFFDAWIQVHHSGINPTGLGIYVLPGEEEGTGTEVQQDGIAILDYITYDLDGNITSYTEKNTAKQLGEYDTTKFYGPKPMTTEKGAIPAGVAEAVIGMKAGGYKKFIVPSWLMSTSVYDSEEKYLKKDSNSDHTIYEIWVRDFTTDIEQWQIGQIGNYFASDSMFEGMTTDDYLKMTVSNEEVEFKGMFYKQTEPPVEDTEFSSDTVIYINYTGKLLNGLVFDTNIEKVAKDNGLYSSSKTYQPVQINWGEQYTDLTMGASKSSVITGFALTLWQMKPMEKGTGVFTSTYGYGYSGSGSSIPAYAPLVFDIEIVAKPED